MTPKQVLNTAARLYGLTPRQMTGPRKDRRHAWARIAAMAMCQHKHVASQIAISRAFHRDHTTVWSACRRAPQLAAENPEFLELYHLLQQVMEADLRVYISGPATGIPGKNDTIFHIVANRINAVPGCAAINPATIGASVCWDRDFSKMSARCQQATYFRAAITNLIGCDAIVQLPGWEDCPAARLEHEMAGACGLIIYASPEDFLNIHTGRGAAVA